MVDLVWAAESPLGRTISLGHQGAAIKPAGVRLAEIRDFSLVLIMARRGRWQAVSRAAEMYLGVEVTSKPQVFVGRQAALIWSGPDQMLALFPHRGSTRPLNELRAAFGSAASLSEQSDGRCMIRVSGARARDMLAKVSSVDLYDSAFPVGTAAATSIDHTGVTLWREPDSSNGQPVYSFLVFSSFAESLWRTLVDSSAEYGMEVTSAALTFSDLPQ